jgi:hypothetical protein
MLYKRGGRYKIWGSLGRNTTTSWNHISGSNNTLLYCTTTQNAGHILFPLTVMLQNWNNTETKKLVFYRPLIIFVKKSVSSHISFLFNEVPLFNISNKRLTISASESMSFVGGTYMQEVVLCFIS